MRISACEISAHAHAEFDTTFGATLLCTKDSLPRRASTDTNPLREQREKNFASTLDVSFLTYSRPVQRVLFRAKEVRQLEQMDPLQRLRAAIESKLSFRDVLPWVIVVALVAACLAVAANERFSSDKVDVTQDCILSNWSAWTGCENNACTGFGVRTRTILKPTSRCTKQQLLQTESCEVLLNCQNPDCQYSDWAEWSDCPDLCFNNEIDCNTLPNQVRFRTIIRPALPGGLPCDWQALVQRRPCSIQGACVPDADCIAAPSNPAVDCNECPDVGCTLTGVPYWTMCTRSLLQSQSGNGARCNRAQLLYSETCDQLPDCTEQCIGNDFGAFSRCSVPCGDGFFVSSTAYDCPSITVGSCTSGSCSAGAFSATTLTTCTTASAFFCSATDVLSFSQCLAQAASNPDTDIVFSVSGGAWIGSSSSMVCDTSSAAGAVFQWNPASTECITPTWDMVNAVCLFLCDANNPNVYSLDRGMVFPFSNGSVSCPITPNLLSISGACPINDATASSRPFGQGQFPNSQTFARSISDPFDNTSFTVLCPMSHDCLYQSWSDAPPWGLCENQCIFGGGTRSRYRSILAPAAFLGNACTPLLTIESVPCNQNDSITSATDNWCSFSTASTTFFPKSTELQCFEECSISRADPSAPGACNSMFLLYHSHTDPIGDREIFLASRLSGAPFSAGNPQAIVDFIAEAFFFAPVSDPTARPANIDEVERMFAQGGQSCFAGFFDDRRTGSTNPTYIPNLGASIQQTGCGGALDQPGLYSNLPGDSPYVFVSSRRKAMLYSKSSIAFAPYVLQPFFFPTSASSPLSQNFTFSYVQSFSDEVSCALQPRRMDQLFLANSCTSFSATPQTITFVPGYASVTTATLLIDVPCDDALDCSLTDWTPISSCSNCRPPEAYFQTRTVVRRATEGGVPCDLFSLIESVPCPQTLPTCDSITTIPLCLPAQFPETQPADPNRCDLLSETYAFLSAWNQSYILPFAQLGESISGVFGLVTEMADTLPMPGDLAVALNAQSVNADGSAPLCVNGIDSVTRAASGNVYEFSISGASALGWALSGCTPDTFWSQTAFSRASNTAQSVTKRVYDLTAQQWICPNACPYVSTTCVFYPNSASCDCGVQSLTAETGFRVWTAGQGLSCGSTSGQVAALAYFDCPNPYVDCPSVSECPIGCDGTPCNSASGFGICSLTNDILVSPLPFYSCSCNNGSTQPDCGNECPIGPNGLTCSGRGTCSVAAGACTCDPGFSGFFCEHWGTAMLGIMEGMLRNGFMSYSVNQGGPNTTGIVSVSNLLGCENENNSACAPASFVYSGGAVASLFELPLLGSFGNDAAAISANFCVNAGDAMTEGSTYVPGHMAQLSVGSLSCANFAGAVNEPFQFIAQFSNNPKWVPSNLIGKRFNVRCMNTDNSFATGGATFTYNRATQFAPDGSRLFDVVGYGEDLLDDLCA